MAQDMTFARLDGGQAGIKFAAADLRHRNQWSSQDASTFCQGRPRALVRLVASQVIWRLYPTSSSPQPVERRARASSFQRSASAPETRVPHRM